MHLTPLNNSSSSSDNVQSVVLTDVGLAPRPAVDTGTAVVPGTKGTAAPGTTGPAAEAGTAAPGITADPGITGAAGITATAPARPDPRFRFDGGIMSGGSEVGTGLRSRAR